MLSKIDNHAVLGDTTGSNSHSYCGFNSATDRTFSRSVESTTSHRLVGQDVYPYQSREIDMGVSSQSFGPLGEFYDPARKTAVFSETKKREMYGRPSTPPTKYNRDKIPKKKKTAQRYLQNPKIKRKNTRHYPHAAHVPQAPPYEVISPVYSTPKPRPAIQQRGRYRSTNSSPPSNIPAYTPTSPALPLMEESNFHPGYHDEHSYSVTTHWRRSQNNNIRTNNDSNRVASRSFVNQVPNASPKNNNAGPFLARTQNPSPRTSVVAGATIRNNFSRNHGVAKSDPQAISRESDNLIADDDSSRPRSYAEATKTIISSPDAQNIVGRFEYDPSQPQYSPSYNPDPFYDDTEYDPAFPLWND